MQLLLPLHLEPLGQQYDPVAIEQQTASAGQQYTPLDPPLHRVSLGWQGQLAFIAALSATFLLRGCVEARTTSIDKLRTARTAISDSYIQRAIRSIAS